MTTEKRFDHKIRSGKQNRLPSNPEEEQKGRFPSWLHRKMPRGENLSKTNTIVEKHGLNTVCEEAKCPNRFECYSKKTATFLALGSACTRACGFCDIDFTKTPKAPDSEEPLKIALSAKELGLRHVVITMVARDDLPDQGAAHIARILQEIRKESPDSTVEVLTSDFKGDLSALDIVLEEKPEVFNHNIETVRSQTSRVRHQATYERTLDILRHAKASNASDYVKSGIMVGLGETHEEVEETISDLYEAGCDIITIGHYLQPSRNKLPVKQFITPEDFLRYQTFGENLGVKHVYSGPFVRSSYNADLFVKRKQTV